MNAHRVGHQSVFLDLMITVHAAPGEVHRPPFSVPDQYIVMLDRKQNLDAHRVGAEMAKAHGGRVGYVWSDAIDGFTIRVPATAAAAIARDSRVVLVEQNSELFISTSQDTTVPPPGAEPGAGSLWALDRVDQQTLPLNGTFNYCDSGFGVKIYVVDTGVLKSHQEFHSSATDTTTRVANGAAFTTHLGDGETPVDRFPYPGDTYDYGTNPCNVMASSTYATDGGGHGTAVASVAAGRLTGTAKGATIVPVKVITCGLTGYVSDAISGLDWILQQHLADPGVPKVVNMSMYYWLPGTTPGTCAAALTSTQVTAFEAAVQSLVTNNITWSPRPIITTRTRGT